MRFASSFKEIIYDFLIGHALFVSIYLFEVNNYAGSIALNLIEWDACRDSLTP